MSVAVFGPLRPRSGEVAEHGERLLPLLARVLEVGVCVDGAAPESPALRDRCRVHDLRTLHYRKVLWRYDLVVYRVGGRGPEAYMEAPIREWPGVVVLHEGGPHERAAPPPLAERVLERSLAVVATSPEGEARLRADLPYALVSAIDPAAGDDALIEAYLRIFAAARARAGQWLEPLLETACAEIPGFLPADPSAPWRAAVDELVGRAGRRPADW